MTVAGMALKSPTMSPGLLSPIRALMELHWVVCPPPSAAKDEPGGGTLGPGAELPGDHPPAAAKDEPGGGTLGPGAELLGDHPPAAAKDEPGGPLPGLQHATCHTGSSLPGTAACQWEHSPQAAASRAPSRPSKQRHPPSLPRRRPSEQTGASSALQVRHVCLVAVMKHQSGDARRGSGPALLVTERAPCGGPASLLGPLPSPRLLPSLVPGYPALQARQGPASGASTTSDPAEEPAPSSGHPPFVGSTNRPHSWGGLTPQRLSQGACFPGPGPMEGGRVERPPVCCAPSSAEASPAPGTWPH
ncbi:nematocyst expressed protein 3-like [Balaenoptera ricei]|uniref:nematocyst expressed protein 3-like n=1 Tax=Balaenoptera ricei TaxID=2746895 RepID=UPI0028BE3878|nr:nematocyst expressed protein 3-like [Balaenoptera ricei]